MNRFRGARTTARRSGLTGRPHRPELRGASHAHAKKGGWGAVCAPLAFCASKIPSFLARWRVRGPAGTGSVGDCVGEGSDEGVQLSKRRADIQPNAGIGIVMELCQKSLAKHILETQQQPANWAEVVPHAHAPLRACPSAAPSRSPISPAILSPRTPSWSPRHPNGAPSQWRAIPSRHLPTGLLSLQALPGARPPTRLANREQLCSHLVAIDLTISLPPALPLAIHPPALPVTVHHLPAPGLGVL